MNMLNYELKDTDICTTTQNEQRINQHAKHRTGKR